MQFTNRLTQKFRWPAHSLTAVLAISLVLAGCGQITPTTAETSTTQASTAQTSTTSSSDRVRPAAWTEESHSNKVEPNYAAVFPQDEVKQFYITVTPETWEAMQANMTDIYGEPNGERGMGGMGGPGNGQMGQPPEGFEPPAEGERPPGDMRGMNQGYDREKPEWVEATIEVDGVEWTHVGIRYKGNSSLMSAWNSGSLKLPLKIDFDQFEDDHPEIHNQRFYGFKQLSFANGFSDDSFMRDAITYDMLEAAGLPAAETAFYEVIIDYGEGPVSLGLYTLIEVVDDTVIEGYFGSDDGNIYEGDGRAASLADGTFDQIAESFQKENNDGDDASWGDIEALYEVLHSDLRTTDPEAWRADLEAIFDVDTFLEWLAISAVIQHWDTYGGMTHNFYLYNNPATDQLTWVSWDHNMTMSSGMGPGMNPGMNNGMGNRQPGMPPMGAMTETLTGTVPSGFPPITDTNGMSNTMPGGGFPGQGEPGGRGPGGRGGMNRNVTLDRAEVTDAWPLIRYLLDQPEYYAQYIAYMQDFADNIFIPEELEAKYTQWAAVIEPYASADVGAESFNNAVQQLIDYAYSRSETVTTFLNEQVQAE